jgi:SAM-dependent methyltransferase
VVDGICDANALRIAIGAAPVLIAVRTGARSVLATSPARVVAERSRSPPDSKSEAPDCPQTRETQTYDGRVSEEREVDAVSAYEAMAADYAAEVDESSFNALYERPGVIELLPAPVGKRALDVGCGSGPLSAWLVSRGTEVVGFDISPNMVRAARSRGLTGATFRVADLGEPLEFLADGSFDVVVASLVFHYLRDWVQPLRELHRVLRPGGALVISTHHPAGHADVELSPSGNYFETELLHDRWVKGGQEYEVRFWRRPLSDMFAAFEQAGFEVRRLTEPQPLPECRDRFPEDWEQLTRHPNFLFFHLEPR